MSQNRDIKELRKRMNLTDFNMRSCLSNLNQLAMEVERIRRVLASKEDYKELSNPLPPHVHTDQAQMQQQQQQMSMPQQSGPMRRGNATQGRTMKVINN